MHVLTIQLVCLINDAIKEGINFNLSLTSANRRWFPIIIKHSKKARIEVKNQTDRVQLTKEKN